MTPDRARLLLLALAAGGLVAFAMPPWGWWPLVFVGIAGLDLLIEGRSRAARFVVGTAFGLGWLMPATLWMWALTVPGYLLAGPMFAAGLGLAMMAVPPQRGRGLALVGTITLWEAVRWSVPFGGVPLATLAMSQVSGPLGSTVRLLGPLLLVALTVTVGIALAAATRRNWAIVGGALATVAVVAAIAIVSPDGDRVGDIRVALVQGGGPQGTQAIDTDPEDVYQRHIEATALVETPVDLVVWPENVIDLDRPLDETPKFDELTQLARDLDAVLIPGVTEDVGDDGFVNASLAISPDGVILDRYEKVKRVPFGEYVPLRSLIEPFAPDYLPTRDAIEGATDAVLETPAGTFGVAISWEVFFDPVARTASQDGAQVLLNPTNGSSYWSTIVQTQQVASSRLRALETGRYVLQASPTGFTAIITPGGDVIDRTGVSEQAVVHGVVELREGETVAVALGRWPMVLVAIALVALAWAPPLRRRAESSDLDHEGDGAVVHQ